MNIQKKIEDRTEELTIQNLIEATTQGNCKWIRITYYNLIQYQHTIHLEGTKTLHVRVYSYNQNNADLNIYMSQNGGKRFVQILSSQSILIYDLLKAIEASKSLNEHVY